MKIGDLVSPKRGRRTGWVGLVIEQRNGGENDFGDRKAETDCLVQWARQPQGPAWWVDWSLEIVSESR